MKIMILLIPGRTDRDLLSSSVRPDDELPTISLVMDSIRPMDFTRIFGQEAMGQIPRRISG